MTFFRKKPVVIEAMLFTDETKDSVYAWISCKRHAGTLDGNPVIKIETLEGEMAVTLGDWVIKGTAGEFYPCKPDIFEACYDAIEESK